MDRKPLMFSFREASGLHRIVGFVYLSLWTSSKGHKRQQSPTQRGLTGHMATKRSPQSSMKWNMTRRRNFVATKCVKTVKLKVSKTPLNGSFVVDMPHPCRVSVERFRTGRRAAAEDDRPWHSRRACHRPLRVPPPLAGRSTSVFHVHRTRLIACHRIFCGKV